MIHEVNGWEEDDDYHYAPEDLCDETVLECGLPGCLMPGEHMLSECHNVDMIEAQNEEPDRDALTKEG